jgi:glycosyltransferase involved in cell wall biosynthesis
VNSICQDNLPNSRVEAHACATPVIAFNTGGLPDIVAHQRTGYLAKVFEIDDLARGIAWVLAQRESGRLGEQAREQAVERFAPTVVAEIACNLYSSGIMLIQS